MSLPPKAFPLPDRLPPGRFLPQGPAGVWTSDAFPEDAALQWPYLLRAQRTHGLVPLLCRPDVLGAPLGLQHVDALELEARLAVDFAEYRRERLPYWSDPTPVPVPEDVEPWPHDPGPPYERWPGLAPAMSAAGVSESPESAACGVVAGMAEAGEHGLAECRLVLVPARRSADVPALLGWQADAPLPLLCALLRSWEDRFGARVVALTGTELHVSVARPPQDAEHAGLLALEHVLSTADNIVDDPPTPFPEYAGSLPGRTRWSFWWD
ncbi:DUF4253 domain-containing protein [Streptomyces sp. TRM66268-LWL]|uniref:DUF4253 domain-containing protein n=1 Tax=Streptomyces polyasparticus TaxID=2767826 RepID=A0ABR7SML4_9ACTN|nr:DUF4253 domain-containing protein [Streptomyces polyasparticus]MBC9716736.1 DUF4253 domain-containing protein [Streptomyces polyasparticus]